MAESRWRGAARLLVAGGFLAASALHFVATDTEARLIPSFFPARRELVLLTGIAEIVGALGLLTPRTRRAASWGLAALLVAIFPANLNHAINNIQVGGLLDSRPYQWARLPFQPLLIWATLWCAAPETSRRAAD